MSYGEPSVTDYYRAVRRAIEQEVFKEPTDSSNLKNRSQYETDLFNRYAWDEITLNGDPTITEDVRRQEIEDSYRRKVIADVYTYTIVQPIDPNPNAGEILRHIGSTYTPGPLNFTYRNGQLVKTTETDTRWDQQKKDREVASAVADMQREADRRNESIRNSNADLRQQITQIIDSRLRP